MSHFWRRCYDPTEQIYYGTTPYSLGNLYTASAPLSGPSAVPTMVECASKTNGQGVWQDSLFTFDNLFAGMLTLFELATTEGWLHMIAYMVDVPSGPGITPLPNSQPFYAVIGFLHIMMGSFVLLNLLVSMIINGYSRIKNENDGLSTMITQEQREWIETKLMILEMAPTRIQTGPDGKFRKFFYGIAQNPWFDFWITMCILANFGAMLSKKHDDSCQHNVVMFWLNFVFAVVFVLEAVIKLIGLGTKVYFKDPWNRTDLAIVCLSNITIAIDFATKQHLCSVNLDEARAAVPGLGVLRAFRIARVFRLVKQFKQLNTMIRTLITSLPALANIMSLICLFLLIFAVLGSTLFWNVSDDQDLYGGVDDDGNYAHFGNAFFLLWRQTTGEVWNSVMYYCSQPDLNLACADTLDDYRTSIGCGMPELGTSYHIIWQFIGTYLMMQLITAVILENFLDMIRDDAAIISKPARDDFVEKWGRFDPDATGTMFTVDLPKLLCELNPPLGVKSESISSIKVLAVIKDLAIPVRGDKVRYKDTFLALVRRAQAYFPEEGEEEDDIFADSEEEDKEESDELDPYETESKSTPSRRKRTQSPSPQHLGVDEADTGEGDETKKVEKTAGEADDEEAKMFRGRRATIAEDYAARLLQVAYKQWNENRLQVHKVRFVQKRIQLSLGSKFSTPRSRLSSERSSRPNISQNGHAARPEPVQEDEDSMDPV